MRTKKITKIINNSKNFSELYREIRTHKKVELPNCFKYKGQILISDNQICNAFLDKFSTSYNICNETIEIPEYRKYTDIEVSMNDVIEALNNISGNKSSGPSKISNHFLILYKDFFVPLIYKLVMLIIETGVIPENLKTSQSTVLSESLKPGINIGFLS